MAAHATKPQTFVKLLGGPRDGQEFEAFSADKQIELAGYGFEVHGHEARCVATNAVHVYERMKAYLGKRGTKTVIFLEYGHKKILEVRT